jgi:hypothetical protein
MLVDAPVGAVTTFASWYARIWSQETVTLQAFVHLLGHPALLRRRVRTAARAVRSLAEVPGRSDRRLGRAGAARRRSADPGARQGRPRPQPRAAARREGSRTLRSRADGDDAAGLPALRRGAWPAADGRRTLRGQLRALDLAHAVARRIRRDSGAPLGRMVAPAGRLPRRVSAASSTKTCACPRLGGSLFDPGPFPLPRRPIQRLQLAHRRRQAAAHRQPHRLAAARSHPAIPGAHAVLPGAGRRTDRLRL